MYAFDSSEEQQPVLWVRGYPLYSAHVIVATYVTSMIVTALSMGLGGSGWLSALVFTSDAVLRGEIWRIVTYGLVNQPTIFFAISMLMIVWFGRELEKVFGRRRFLTFFGCVYVLTPLLFTILGPWLPMTLAGETGSFALFIAFAAFYPNIPVFFGLLAKWLAVILVGLYTLMAISRRDVGDLISLWATALFAVAYVRHQQGRFSVPAFRLPRSEPKLKVIKGEGRAPVATPKAAVDTTMEEVDALLDKIAQSGINSLTRAERAKLDAAQADLLRRKSGRR